MLISELRKICASQNTTRGHQKRIKEKLCCKSNLDRLLSILRLTLNSPTFLTFQFIYYRWVLILKEINSKKPIRVGMHRSNGNGTNQNYNHFKKCTSVLSYYQLTQCSSNLRPDAFLSNTKNFQESGPFSLLLRWELEAACRKPFL